MEFVLDRGDCGGWEKLGEPCVGGFVGGLAMDVAFRWAAVVLRLRCEGRQCIGRGFESFVGEGC